MEAMNRKSGRLKKAFYGSVTIVISQLVSIGCGFILPHMILNAYGSTYNGIISSITQFLGFFSVLQAGIQGSTRVALYKTLAVNDHEGTSAIMVANERYYRKISYILIGYIMLLAAVFPFMLNENVDTIDIVLLVLIIGGSNFVQYNMGNVYKALLNADQAGYILNILTTVTLITNTVVCALIILSGQSVIIAKLGSSIVYALNPIVLYIYVRKHYHLNKKATPNLEALKGRWDVLANSLANIVHEHVDIFCVTFFCNAAEVSVYTVYALISTGIMRLMSVFTNGIEAAFGDMWVKGERDVLLNNFRKYEYIMFSLAGILTGCMMVLSLPFVQIYTKGVTDVEYARPIFSLVLALSITTMCIRTPYVMMVQATGRYKETKYGSFAEAIINLVLTYFLVQKVGIIGAPIGTVVANVFRSFQYAHYASKHLILRSMLVVFKRSGWLTGTMVSAYFISTGILSRLDMQSWFDWIVAAVICGSVHLCIFFISSILFYRRDFLDATGAMKRLFTKKKKR